MVPSKPLSVLLVVIGGISTVLAAPTVILPDDPNILFQGRWDLGMLRAPRQGWSVSGFSVAFTNSTSALAFIRDEEQPNWFRVWLDGAVVFSGENAPGRGLGVAAGLDPGRTHTLRVAKRSEVYSGESVLERIELSDGGRSVPPPQPPRRRRIEFIGDSVTCGYGCLGTPPCEYSLNLSDATAAWASITADRFDAELHVECYSGIGYVRNYGDTSRISEWPMPRLYPFTTTRQHGAIWNPALYTPDVVVIRLGTDDYSPPQSSWPTDEEFVSGVMDFLSLLLKQYPETQIIAACGATSVLPCPNVATAVAKLVSDRVHFLRLTQLDPAKQYGCAGHPNVAGQQVIAGDVSKVIKDILGW